MRQNTRRDVKKRVHNRGRLVVPLAVVLAAAGVAAADQPGDTASVAVTVTVLPFAEVSLDVDQVEMVLPDGGHAEPVYVGGDIATNVPATIYTRITKPQDAPGDWYALPEVRELYEAGSYRFDNLLEIGVWDIPDGEGGGTYVIALEGRFAESYADIVTPGDGTAILTVVPE
ncbi:MAG: hypothetical protein ACOC95_09585 [Planctomycetota bacterium]